eukprot:TRINITY_DN768_c1_g1_i2.p1 TRINITY_DN768_c1_g1~~TRINITY_DN768_c1_g1_i2.p1  ORF type:complete len:158 (-),score=24.82 TRINITY_DN768_c1_g1_i2:478-951(-)
MGRIIHFSGPHVGCMHDKYLYDTFHPPFQQGELCLGDLGYWGCDEHIITPHKRSRNQPVLDLPQLRFNFVQQYYRARSEHAIAFLKRFQVIGGVYRGHVSKFFFEALIKTVIHINAYANRRRGLRSLHFEQLGYLDLDQITDEEVLVRAPGALTNDR